jgi:hypothetical protein
MPEPTFFHVGRAVLLHDLGDNARAELFSKSAAPSYSTI